MKSSSDVGQFLGGKGNQTWVDDWEVERKQ